MCHNFLLEVYNRSDSLTFKTVNKYVPEIIVDKRKRVNVLTKSIKSVVGVKHQIHATGHPGIYNCCFDSYKIPAKVDLDTGRLLKDCDYLDALFHSLFDNNALRIFTDGSKVKDGEAVGSACTCPELNIINDNGINPAESIFTTDCNALSNAMMIALRNRHRNVNILTDSLSAVQALSRLKFDAHTNHHLLSIRQMNAIFYLNNDLNTKVTIIWIPAHVGVTENEFADTEARRATRGHPTSYRFHSQT